MHTLFIHFSLAVIPQQLHFLSHVEPISLVQGHSSVEGGEHVLAESNIMYQHSYPLLARCEMHMAKEKKGHLWHTYYLKK